MLAGTQTVHRRIKGKLVLRGIKLVFLFYTAYNLAKLRYKCRFQKTFAQQLLGPFLMGLLIGAPYYPLSHFKRLKPRPGSREVLTNKYTSGPAVPPSCSVFLPIVPSASYHVKPLLCS